MKKINYLFVLLITFLFLSQTFAQPTNTPKVEFEKYVLPNGLQVILHVDRKLPVVHVNEWVHVGSKNEKIGRTGFAHLFEHMMFQGSKNAAGEYFSYVEKAGANLFEGGVNGTTSWDRTNYFATVPSSNLENILWLESDRLATLTEVLTKKNLDNQRDVVKNERRQGLENTPYGRAEKLIMENLFPYRHPYANDVIGSHEDLTAASEDDVKEFFKTYYTPNNLTLAIVGDFDVAEAKRLIEKYFGTLPTGPALERPAKDIVKLNGEKIIEVNDRISQDRTYMNWVSPAFFDEGEAEINLLNAVLTDGLSARLTKALVYDKQLCSGVVSYPNTLENTGVFHVEATARPGVALEQIEQIITEEIAKLAKDGPTDAELNRAKTKWEFGFVSGLERIGGFGGKADRLNQYNTYLGSPDKFAADITRHRNVTKESARAVAAKWLDTRNRLLVRFRTEKSGRESAIAVDRAKIPALGADRTFNVPGVKSAKLENGMEVLVAERNDLPKVSVLLATRTGAVNDSTGKEGLASMTPIVMRHGTKNRQSLEIENALGDLGTEISGGSGYENSFLSFEVLKQNLTPALGIFSDVVRNPAFSADELDRDKKRRIDALAQESQDANAIVNVVGPGLAYGFDHPYGRPMRGRKATIEKLTSEDFASYHSQFWKPGSSVIVFAGQISLDEAVALAKQNFGSWSGGSAPLKKIPAAAPVGAGKIYLIDRQDAAQTVVAQMLPAPGSKSDEFYALKLADAIWGGGFGTRLNLNLREDKGYSYGVFSFTSLYPNTGLWIASGGVQTNKTKESVVEFVKELKGLAGEKPLTEKELENAKANRVRGYAQSFETLGGITNKIVGLWLDELPLTRLQSEPEQLTKTPLTSVNAIAQKYAKPTGATLLLVGDLAKIEAGIRELNLGEIVILDAEGKPVKK